MAKEIEKDSKKGLVREVRYSLKVMFKNATLSNILNRHFLT